MCGYFWTGFIDFMLTGKIFLDYTNLFSPNEYEKNNKIILKYKLNQKTKIKKSIVLIVVSIENLKIVKHQSFLKKKNISSCYYL